MLLLLRDGCPVSADVRPRDRLLVRLRASRLDGNLAAGESPDATVALSLRARMLVRMQTRRDLARARYDVLLATLRLRQASGQLTPADVLEIDRLLAP